MNTSQHLDSVVCFLSSFIISSQIGDTGDQIKVLLIEKVVYK